VDFFKISDEAKEREYDEAYRRICRYTDPRGVELRKALEAECEEFRRLGLGNTAFLRDLQNPGAFSKKIWEVRLGVWLSRCGHELTRGNSFPDFVVKDRRLGCWVEATVASRDVPGNKPYLGPERKPIPLESAFSGAKIPTYRPDFERVAIRIETRMSEKIDSIRNHRSKIRTENIPIIIALEISDISDEFHSGYVGPIFFGFGDFSARTTSDGVVNIISEAKSVRITDPGELEKDIGYFRREPLLSGVLLSRTERFEPIDNWNERVTLLINPWAEFGVPDWLVPKVRRVNKIAEWTAGGAIFDTPPGELRI